jgi:hypothetical protein
MIGNYIIYTGKILFASMFITVILIAALIFVIGLIIDIRRNIKRKIRDQKRSEELEKMKIEFDKKCKEEGSLIAGSILDYEKFRSQSMSKVEYLKIKRHSKYGWVIFRKINGELYNLFYERDISVPVDFWEESKAFLKDLTVKSGNIHYRPGFHIFLYKCDAEQVKEIFSGKGIELVIKKVLFDEIIETGYEIFTLGTTFSKDGLKPVIVEMPIVVSNLRKVLL